MVCDLGSHTGVYPTIPHRLTPQRPRPPESSTAQACRFTNSTYHYCHTLSLTRSVFLDFSNEAGVSRLNAPCPCLAPRGCRVTHLLTPCPLGLGVDFAADTRDPLEPHQIVVLLMEKESQEVMLRSQLSRRHSCQARHSKVGYHLGVKLLPCHCSFNTSAPVPSLFTTSLSGLIVQLQHLSPFVPNPNVQLHHFSPQSSKFNFKQLESRE